LLQIVAAILCWQPVLQSLAASSQYKYRLS
jgi:hypothetical protein